MMDAATTTVGVRLPASFCAICIGVSDLRPVKLDDTVYAICRKCDDNEAIEPSSGTKRYAPIDEVLDSMRMRILRTLRHFDWVDSKTLIDVLKIEEYVPDVDGAANECSLERGRYQADLARAVRDGLVECDRSVRSLFLYCITPAGREFYAKELARNQAPATWRARA